MSRSVVFGEAGEVRRFRTFSCQVLFETLCIRYLTGFGIRFSNYSKICNVSQLPQTLLTRKPYMEGCLFFYRPLCCKLKMICRDSVMTIFLLLYHPPMNIETQWLKKPQICRSLLLLVSNGSRTNQHWYLDPRPQHTHGNFFSWLHHLRTCMFH